LTDVATGDVPPAGDLPPADSSAPSLRKDEGVPWFRRVLIANRGEIAVRIIRACRELGIETVAVYSDADAHAGHVRVADDAVRLGPAPAPESYLRGDAIVEAALATGAKAIHPGYGFLAERASFAQAVEDAGLVFVGPSAATIRALGDKLSARRGASAAGVPVVPGTLEPVPVDRPDQVEGILAEAERIGFPLLVKAAAGGGGRGMRRVATPAELPAALAVASSEARAAFGDGTVYLEREILPARHIEVQLLGDAFGTIVALGERDCSVQRRHQKLIEEAPAPGLSADERLTLHDLALRAARAAGLRNAATAEFLFDPDRNPWFLEVNTRLQVEHGVTELVAGVDIVREQLAIAAGRPLSERVLRAAAEAAAPRRHAIEARLSAEDPARAFAPTPGTITRWVVPSGPGVRVDTAIEPGDRVPPDYDPLIAKLLVVDDDRPAALDRLARALDEVEVGGVQTTLPFDRFLVRDPTFRAGPPSIDWVDTEWEGLLGPVRDAALAMAGHGAAAAAAGRLLPSGREGRHASDPSEGAGGAPATRSPAGSSAWTRAGRQRAVERWPR
jgi:acetyl/propionyl-CoA carboxylase alpha subunit